MTLHEFDITFFYGVGSPQLLCNCGVVDRAAGSNKRGPSSISGRAVHLFVNSSQIMKFLLKTNDKRGGMKK